MQGKRRKLREAKNYREGSGKGQEGTETTL